RHAFVHAPEIVVPQLLRARRLERGDRAALRVERGEHAAHRAVLAAAVDGLQNCEHCVATIGVELVLQLPQSFAVRFERFERAFLFPTERLARPLVGEVRTLAWLQPQLIDEIITCAALVARLLTHAASGLRRFRSAAGTCCVMQWMLPPPSSTSRAGTPITRRRGNSFFSCAAAVRSVRASSSGRTMPPLAT